LSKGFHLGYRFGEDGSMSCFGGVCGLDSFVLDGFVYHGSLWVGGPDRVVLSVDPVLLRLLGSSS
jgi:hypothetical protein